MEGCAKGCELPVTKARNSRRRVDGRWEHIECPAVQPHERRETKWDHPQEIHVGGTVIQRPVGPCPCECNSGGFCGGCGHAGCGGLR